MENATTTIGTLTIGIDIDDRHSHLCLLDDGGKVIEDSRLATTPEAFRDRFAGLSKVGTRHSRSVSALLAELGHEVLVANPRKLRMIYRNDSKNDRCDAEQLARVARMDPSLLYPIEHRGRQAAVDLVVRRSRATPETRCADWGNPAGTPPARAFIPRASAGDR